MTDDEENKLRRAVNVINLEVQRLQGRAAALESVLLSAIETHRNLPAFAAASHAGLERIEATLLGGSLSEAGLKAFQEARALVDAAMRLALTPPVDRAG